MSIDNPRPGSMLAAEVKQNKVFRLVLTGIFAILISMCYLNLFDTYLYDYQLRSGFVADLFSFIFFGVGVLFVWFHQWFEDKFIGEKNGWVYPAVLVISLIMGFCCAAGFNFSLAGIEPGVTN